MKISTILERSRVQNATESEELQYLQKAADLLSNELDLNDREVTITFDPPYDLDASQYGATIGLGRSPKKIFIFVDKDISTGEKLRALAHEMVHAQQLASGKLAILNFEKGQISGEWDGEPFEFLRYSKSNPWEVEAYTKEKSLQKFVINKLGNFHQNDVE